jgi:hypothetical protein
MTEPTITPLLDLIHAEYREMPGLCLTKPQFQRLWRLDPITCEVVLDALLVAQVLKRTVRDGYVLAGGHY